jgi:acetyltransferase-like isoleucine patch superfamily enzyme
MFGGEMLPTTAFHVSLLRSLYLSARFRGAILVMRGTRVSLGHGARIQVPHDSKLIVGTGNGTGRPAELDLRDNASLVVRGSGTVRIGSGANLRILSNAHLEIGYGTYISQNSTVSCFKQVKVGPNCAISWNVNIFDVNGYELIVEGVPRSRRRPVQIGSHVWIGSGATVMGAAIGDGSVVGAASVVVSDVPENVVVAGNPARVIRKDASWR